MCFFLQKNVPPLAKAALPFSRCFGTSKVTMILDHLPKVAGEVSFEAVSGGGAAVRSLLGLAPAAPMLLTEIDKALRAGQKTPLELLHLVWQQPEAYYHEKHAAYVHLFHFFRVNAHMNAARRFTVQFFISFLALKEHVPQGYLEWARGKRNPGLFTKDLVRLETPSGEDLRAKAVKMLENVDSMTLGEISNQAFMILREVQPPQLQPETSPRQIAEEAVENAMEQLKKIQGLIASAKSIADSRKDLPEKDSEVRGAQQTIQQKIDNFKENNEHLLSFHSNPDLCDQVAKLERQYKEISPQRSKEFLQEELLRTNRFLLPSRCRAIPTLMNLEEYKVLLEKSNNKIEISQVKGRYAGNDSGSGAKQDLEFADFEQSGWLMFGHCKQGDQMWIVKAQHSSLVTENEGWECVWDDRGSRKRREYAVWMPTHGNPNFKPLGVICMFRKDGYPEPKMKVAMVHKDILEESRAQSHVWRDKGTSATHDITLEKNLQLNSLWPTHLTKVKETTPTCWKINENYLLVSTLT